MVLHHSPPTQEVPPFAGQIFGRRSLTSSLPKPFRCFGLDLSGVPKGSLSRDFPTPKASQK